MAYGFAQKIRKPGGVLYGPTLMGEEFVPCRSWF